jgi:archaellum component FlaC
MSVTIESDLKEILNRIDQRLDKLDTKIDNLSKDITDIKVGVAKLEEKVDGLSKRIDNQEFISRGILIGLIVAILGGFAKLFGFVGVQ